jgi:uncharacterized protein (TIRG00374 family)
VKLSRPVKVGLQLAVSGGLILYLVWRIDLRQTLDLIGSSNGWDLLAAFTIFLITTAGMAWRWQVLLAWLTKLYFISYAASHVLPTVIGGDAVRITAHARRRTDVKSEAAAAVLMERVVGSAGTLILVAFGLVLAIGRYSNIELLIWLEVAFVIGLSILLILLFSTRANAWLQARGSTRRLARAFQSVWQALHSYRDEPGALLAVLGITLAIQISRIFAIWFCGEAVGLDLSPLVYVVMGPLLFLVMMVPFTINGLGVREAFFIAFLGRFGVDADAAFATGFLFYAVTIAASIPGGFILLWESLRPAAPRPTAGA